MRKASTPDTSGEDGGSWLPSPSQPDTTKLVALPLALVRIYYLTVTRLHSLFDFIMSSSHPAAPACASSNTPALANVTQPHKPCPETLAISSGTQIFPQDPACTQLPCQASLSPAQLRAQRAWESREGRWPWSSTH